jgi:hypothetical protein
MDRMKFERFATRRAKRQLGIWLLVTVLVFGVGAWWNAAGASSSPLAMPLPVVDRSEPSPTASSALSVAHEFQAATTAREIVGQGVVAVTVLDANGRAIPRIEVIVSWPRRSRMVRGSWSASSPPRIDLEARSVAEPSPRSVTESVRGITDADGRWRTPALERCTCDVHLTVDSSVGKSVLVDNEQVDVVLQLPPDEVCVRVAAERDGEPFHGLVNFLHAQDGLTACSVTTEPPEPRLAIVASGQYRLEVLAADQPLGVLGRRELSVPAYAGQIDVTVAVDGARAEIRARRASEPCQRFEVHVEESRPDPQQRPRRRKTAKGGLAVFEDLTPGEWSACIEGPDVVRAVHAFTIAAGDRRVEVDVSLEPAGTIELVLRSSTGSWFPPELVPPLTGRGKRFECVDLGKVSFGAAPSRGIGYLAVPIGPVELVCSDTIASESISFLPFDPPRAVALDVVRSHHQLMVDIIGRARVQLFAAEASGRQDPTATLEVFAGALRVQPIVVPLHGGWLAYLPPGDYRAVVTKAGTTREHMVRVERRSLELRLRP